MRAPEPSTVRPSWARRSAPPSRCGRLLRSTSLYSLGQALLGSGRSDRPNRAVIFSLGRRYGQGTTTHVHRVVSRLANNRIPHLRRPSRFSSPVDVTPAGVRRPVRANAGLDGGSTQRRRKQMFSGSATRAEPGRGRNVLCDLLFEGQHPQRVCGVCGAPKGAVVLDCIAGASTARTPGSLRLP